MVGNREMEVLQTLVVALCAGLGVWGVINLLEGSEPLVHLPAEGSAVFRYLKNEQMATEILIAGVGEALVSIFCDGVLVGSGKADTVISVHIPSGLHKFTIKAEDADFLLTGFQLS